MKEPRPEPTTTSAQSRDAEVEGPSFVERLRAAPVTALFTVVNIVVFGVAEWWGNTLEPETLLAFGASYRGLVWAGEWWRFFTPMFLHIGVIHLAWNTWALVGWCQSAERGLGSLRFALGYLAAGVGATATSLAMHNAISAGASGAGFGVVGIHLAFFARRSGGVIGLFKAPESQSLLISVGVWTALGFATGIMDNWAHLGGLMFGFAFGFAVSTPKHRGALALTAFALALAAVVVLAARPWPFLPGVGPTP